MAKRMVSAALPPLRCDNDYGIFDRFPTKQEWMEPVACDAIGIPPIYRAAPEVDLSPLPWQGGCFIGPPGCGKTTEAVRRLKGAVYFDEQGKVRPLFRTQPSLYGPPVPLRVKYDAMFVKVPRLIARLREHAENSRKTNETLEEIRDAAMNRRFVVLDDLGVSKSSEFVMQELYAIIDHRVENALPTLVTSNLTMEQLGRALDPRLVDRLYRFGPIRSFEDKRYRLAAAKFETE